MNVWGITDRGKIREQNQDAFAHQVLPDGRVIALVCDGMGGAVGGNIASRVVVDSFAESAGSLFMEAFLEDGEDSPDLEHMERAAARANRQVFRRAVEDENCVGMGTTLVAALAGEEEALILNEGDSRAYHISEESGISQVTRDHSLVEDLVERGELTRDQARVHPHKNLITRALGAEPDLKADSFRRELTEGDFLLLCSDGLSNVVSEQEILYEVVHGGEACPCCRRLLDIALHRGAPDNVTAVLIQC